MTFIYDDNMSQTNIKEGQILSAVVKIKQNIIIVQKKAISLSKESMQKIYQG